MKLIRTVSTDIQSTLSAVLLPLIAYSSIMQATANVSEEKEGLISADNVYALSMLINGASLEKAVAGTYKEISAKEMHKDNTALPKEHEKDGSGHSHNHTPLSSNKPPPPSHEDRPKTKDGTTAADIQAKPQKRKVRVRWTKKGIFSLLPQLFKEYEVRDEEIKNIGGKVIEHPLQVPMIAWGIWRRGSKKYVVGREHAQAIAYQVRKKQR